MKRKNAFTLIELLAVIVVLAIIALIATPIVMNTIKNAKKGAAERSADSYIKQVEITVATKRLEGNILEGEYIVQSDGNLCPVSGCGEDDKDKIIVEMEGNKPTSGTIKISNGEVENSSTMTIGDYSLVYSDNKWTAMKVETYRLSYNLKNVSGEKITTISSTETKTLTYTANTGYQLPDSITVTGATHIWNKETGTLILSKATGDVTVTIVGEEKKAKTYANGEVVYFNVTTGKKCSDYTETQSKTGVKGGCMKFYAFNDNGGSNVNLLLDHNTTATVSWNIHGSNVSGPSEVLTQLNDDTKTWVGTETPSNYTVDQSTQGSKAKYTIDYSNYKARLITAQEVAQITGNTTWDEKISTSAFYFDTNTSTASATCKSGNTSGCKFGWLYDRTDKSCTSRGCLNNSDVSMYGYWTISPEATYPFGAWNVCYAASLASSTIDGGVSFGVRPVIEVLRSKLS